MDILCTTGIPAVRDEIQRQVVQRERLVGLLVEVVEATGGRTARDSVAFSLLALVDGLAQRLMLGTTTKARRLARQVLDSALRST